MRSRIVFTSCIALVAGLGLAPAHAQTACFGTGQAVLEQGINYFPNLTSNVPFSFTFNCATGGSLTGTGILWTASCGQSFGTATVPGIGTVGVQTAGSMVVISPVVVDPRTSPPTVTTTGTTAAGGGNATPIPDLSTNPPGNTCSSGTARVFQLTGGGVF